MQKGGVDTADERKVLEYRPSVRWTPPPISGDEETLHPERELSEKQLRLERDRAKAKQVGEAIKEIQEKFDRFKNLIDDQLSALSITASPTNRRLAAAIWHISGITEGQFQQRLTINNPIYQKSRAVVQESKLGTSWGQSVTEAIGEGEDKAQERIDNIQQWSIEDSIQKAWNALKITFFKWLMKLIRPHWLLRGAFCGLAWRVVELEEALGIQTINTQDLEQGEGEFGKKPKRACPCSKYGPGGTGDDDQDGPIDISETDIQPPADIGSLFTFQDIEAAQVILNHVSVWARSRPVTTKGQYHLTGEEVNRVALYYQELHDQSRPHFDYTSELVTLEIGKDALGTLETPIKQDWNTVQKWGGQNWENITNNTEKFYGEFSEYFRTVAKDAITTFLDGAIRILENWYTDPTTLCCLLRNLGDIGKIEIKILHYMRFVLQFGANSLTIKLDDLFNGVVEFINAIVQSVAGLFVGILHSWLHAGKDLAGKQFQSALGLMSEEQKRCLPFDELLILTRDTFYGILDNFEHYVSEYFATLKLSYIKLNRYNFLLEKKMLFEVSLDRLERVIGFINAAGDLNLPPCKEGEEDYARLSAGELRDMLEKYIPAMEASKVLHKVPGTGEPISPHGEVTEEALNLLGNCADSLSEVKLKELAKKLHSIKVED